jgi:hypothetical protein
MLWQALWRERPAAVCYLLAALLALCFLAHLFPLAFFLGRSAFFEQIDASQHIAGWLFYVRDSWHFPLLHTERLNHPAGVSIAFTDSIPIAALLFKSIRFLLPEGFHYLGWWHALAFIAQAVAASFLIRALGVSHALGAICAAAFALIWPALLWRLGHTSLMTQGLMLFAAGAYFIGREGRWRSSATAATLIATCAVALMIHPYLLAFCFALFLAFLADQALGGEGWLRQLPRLLLSVAVMTTLGFVLGYFGNGTTATGFDYYSMNLDAPVCGGRFLACVDSPAAHQFAAYNFADATGGQYEGFNYFGAGMLLLLPFAAIGSWRCLPVLAKRYPALLLTCLLLALYALSNRIYLGTQEVFSYPLPAIFDKLTGTFRASGRFFWVTGYLLLFGTLAALLKKPSWRGMLVLAVALPLQWFDTQPLRARIIAKAEAPAANDVALWEKAMEGIDKLHIYPAFGCGDGEPSVHGFFTRVAAHYGKLIDTGYFARPNIDCERNARSFDAEFASQRLYVMSAEFLKNPFAVPLGFQNAALHGECARWRATIACRPGANEEYWKRTGLAVEHVAPFTARRLMWRASELPTLVGMVKNDRLVPSRLDKAGFLSYGPYIVLSPGRYHYAIRYVSTAVPQQDVGRWDVVIGSGKPDVREAGAGTLRGSAGVPQTVEGSFTTDRWSGPLEIRTHYNASGDLQILDIALEKAP